MSREKNKLPGKRPNESLGWLAGSSMQPKKRKEIEGVSAASLVALKSQVAKKQQETSGEGAAPARPRGGRSAELLARQNAGVAERAQRDRLELKTPADRLTDSREALERKAALYDRLAAGHADEADAERYEVDFEMKGRHHRPAAGAAAVDTVEAAVYTGTGGMVSADMAMEQERRAWEASMREGAVAEEVAEERRELIAELERETREQRDRAAVARQARQAAENKKRERLKAEFLRRRLEAAKKGQGGPRGAGS